MAQMVQVSGNTLIFPSRPPFTDDHALSLSHLDTDRNLHLTFRYLRAYVNTHPSSSADPLPVISSALSQALVHYYPLAGKLRRRQHEDQRLEISCSAGQGLPLIRANVDCTLESVNYLDDPESPFLEQLVPDPDMDEAMEHPCVLQITVFKCGAFTLGAVIHHSLCDGLGGTQFFSAAAELARGATRITVEPIWNREKLLGPRNPTRIDSPVIGEFLHLEKGFLPYEQNIGPVVRASFHVRDECLEKFKRSLFEQSGLNFTTFEALGAYIWRSKVKASGIEDDEKIKFAYSINIRKLMKPPLPEGYWGNGCVPMYVKMRAKDVIEKPIWETAEQIKKSKSNVSDEYVRSFIDFQEKHYGDGVTAGKGVSGFTDWRHLGHSSVDFGWGGPVTVLPLARNLLGSVEPCFFLPYSTASSWKKDGFKVLVTLAEAALPAFREDMELFSNSHQVGQLSI
ncbi:3'-N-debenzoyl-2'-deoxytaxol N-benzoyltransferase [Neltuma alba]|uniref:3'-N-debenzoyl-2'-deoxytaxol N-benzoyltransferase n=1 Tax=Neltuma alba TaxID=207710 RepID=UPI0010A4EA95|nr:3'-N-debenzoyl-2'-deoxytaxol N-benzoyltransferase [Prosopis alba]